LSGEETALFKILMSDPCPEIREEAAKRIALGEEAFKEILDKGVPIVTHYEYGKSIVENQQDNFVLRGLLANPILNGFIAAIREKLTMLEKETLPNSKILKIILSGKGSELVQGFITKEEYEQFNQFKSNNLLLNNDIAWLAYLESKSEDFTNPSTKENYWDYNDVSHFTGINLDDLRIEVFTENDVLIFSTTYDNFMDLFEDTLEDLSINKSEQYGNYFYPKTTEIIVTYRSIEKFSFEFQLSTSNDFDPKKLGMIRVSTDEMGYGTDYGDYTLGIVYDGAIYDDVDHASFGGSTYVYFES
jgi:hypothetical protein